MSAAPSSTPDVLSLAREYVSWESNAADRSSISSLLAANDVSALSAAFLPRIAFGTAGLRARMSGGYHNICELVIIQTSQGFARYIEETANKEGKIADFKSRGIVVGYDGRHNSRTYAEIVAAVFLGAGFRVHLYSRIVGTPFVPYAVSQLSAIAGVMVTASHNPKDDNGYKVYWSNGAQIIQPHDANISAHIQANLPPWHLAPNAEPSRPSLDLSNPLLSDPFEQMTTRYFDDAKRLYCWNSEENGTFAQTDFPVTFTAMHGVGSPFTRQAFASFNLPPFYPTPRQMEVDPDFSTVKFPNPEEGKGALALAIESANASHSRLILANDPDADRLAVAEKITLPSGEEVWKPLNGNQIALLLANWVLCNYKDREHPSAEQMRKSCMIASTVSSGILGSMAKKEGFNFYPTLTGFKWMGNRAYDAVHASPAERFLFAYEVEIGFLVGNMSYDKDGIRTAAIFYEMYLQMKRKEKGKSCHEKLEELYEKYGFFHMQTSYFFCDPLSGKLGEIFARLRNFPSSESDKNTESPFKLTQHRYPTSVGGIKILSVRDVSFGYDSSESNCKSKLPIDTSASMITFRFENGGTATLRNSGTEPKLKYYVECNATDRKTAEDMTAHLTRAVIDELIRPSENQLIAPKTE